MIILDEINRNKKKFKRPVAAFVQFETQEGKERAEKYWDSHLNDFGYLEENDADKYVNILDEDLELFGEVPEPSNMIWKNLFNEPLILLRNKIAADIILFFTLFGILSIFIYVKSAAGIVAKKYKVDNDCSNYQNIDSLDHFKTVALHD